MPDQRIKAILDEISSVAINPRVGELIAELGNVLAELAIIERDHSQDADERFKTIGSIYRQLRRDFRTLKRFIDERDHSIAAKLHQLSSRMMLFEMQLGEIADALNVNVDITREKVLNGDDLEHDDDTTTEQTNIAGSSTQ